MHSAPLACERSSYGRTCLGRQVRLDATLTRIHARIIGHACTMPMPASLSDCLTGREGTQLLLLLVDLQNHALPNSCRVARSSIACHRRSDRSAVAVSCGEVFFCLFICCFRFSGLLSVFLTSGSGTYDQRRQSSRLDEAWRSACSSFPPPGMPHCYLAMLVNPCLLYVSGARRRVSLVGLWQTGKKAGPGRSIQQPYRHHHRFVTSVQGYKSKI
jgi:hypothetical protein